MTATPDPQPSTAQTAETQTPPAAAEKILCRHCLRTASNGIKYQGICVADSDY